MKKEKKVWALTLLAFWWLSPNYIQAQQTDSVRTLDEVIITGTRVEQPVIEVPRSVTVMTRDMLEKSIYNSVGELLTAQAGIYIVGATQTPGTNQSVFLRGANSNQVVVLIDGLRVADPSSPNGSIDLSEISLTNVERIEIIRGSHSTLYGGSAIGGAINIITKKASGTGLHGNGALQAGTFGSGSLAFNGIVNLNYRSERGVFAHAGVFSQHVQGLNATLDTIKTEGVYKTADEDDFRKTDVYVKAGYLKDNWDASVSLKRVDQDADIDDRAYDDDDNSFLDFQRTLLDYRLGYTISPSWKVSATGSWSPSKRYLQNDSSVIDHNGNTDKTYIESTYNGKTVTNEIILHHSTDRWKNVFGAGQYFEQMDFNTYYFSNAFGFPFESKVNYDTIDTSSRTNYLFMQSAYDIGHLNLKAGARLSSHSLFGTYWTFELNPSYSFHNTLVYASVSTGYNAPSLYQLFDPSINFGYTITRGNKSLTPEKSLSLELGIKKEFNNGTYVTLSGFSSRIRNNIEYVYLWNKETPIPDLSFSDFVGDTYINISQQEVYGLELEGHAVIGKFYLHGNLSRMTGKITIDPTDIPMDETEGHHVQLYNYGPFVEEEVTINSLARRPKFTGLVEIGYQPINAMTIAATLRHTGARNDVAYDAGLGPFGALSQSEVNQYTLVDLGLNYRFTKAVTAAIRVENLLDERYSEIYGFQTRGRSAYLKALFTW